MYVKTLDFVQNMYRLVFGSFRQKRNPPKRVMQYLY